MPKTKFHSNYMRLVFATEVVGKPTITPLAAATCSICARLVGAIFSPLRSRMIGKDRVGYTRRTMVVVVTTLGSTFKIRLLLHQLCAVTSLYN